MKIFLREKIPCRQGNSQKDFTMAAGLEMNIIKCVKSNKQCSMSEKDVKHKAEKLVRKHDVVQLSKKEARGWCNATVEGKARTKGRRIFTGKQEILTYIQ